MAYNINGKVYTDHPLMDEIVYNCKLILKGIVIKNDVLANDNEDESFLENTEIYMMIQEGAMTFELFPFTFEILRAFGYSSREAQSILNNKENVPEADREDLTTFAIEYFNEHYEEQNNYYRMLMGLPPYGTTEYDVYIDRSYFPANYKNELDFSKPLHEFDGSVIAILQSTGKFDEILDSHRGSNYSYLRYIGDNRIDLYFARKSGKYDILYLPNAEAMVLDRFQELYNLNRDIYLKRTYSEAYAFDSEYYEQCMILMILCQTFNDMIVDVPEWYIRRDIFDIRSVQYFLEAYGVEFYKEIPLKYQIRIVKNLNKLIKYKSSNKSFDDILEIFQLKNTSIFKYYLFKKRLKNSTGHYTDGATNAENYDLEFVRARINESYDNYIKDLIYRTPYDDITSQDKYWDGQNDHEWVKQQHLNRDFTIEGTKYMSIDYQISMSEYLFQSNYLLNLVLDSSVDMDDLKIGVPSIQATVNFRLSDLFLLLHMLSLGYDNCETTIRRPEKTNPEGPDPGLLYLRNTTEPLYDWMKKWCPEMFIEPETRRVYGFNSKVDLEKVKEVIGRRHSQYQFNRGFTLEDMGAGSYIVPTKITSFQELTDLYYTNKECYDNLTQRMAESVDDRDEYVAYQFVFDQLFTRDFDYDYYTINQGTTEAEYLEQILEDRDYILYNTYTKIMSETNMETRRDSIRNIMNEITGVLEYFLSGEGLEYVFSFTTIANFNSLIHYIFLMINFFKSYKVYFLDPYVTYVIDDRLENNVKGAGDAINELRLKLGKNDAFFTRDVYGMNVSLELGPDKWEDRVYEVLDVYGHFEPDPNDDYDYNGMYPDTNLEYKDANGGVPDPWQCVPYIMLNAGRPQGNRRDLWDINGYGVEEPLDYYDANGGSVLHPNDYRRDYMGSAFRYELDGGSPGTNQFYSKSLYTRVVDGKIESDVRISEVRNNALVQREDGLYLPETWVKVVDFESFDQSSRETMDFYEEMYEILLDNIIIASDPELLDQRIQETIDEQLSPVRQVVSYMEDDEFEERLKKYVDDGVDRLYDEFYSFSPYAWEDF